MKSRPVLEDVYVDLPSEQVLSSVDVPTMAVMERSDSAPGSSWRVSRAGESGRHRTAGAPPAGVPGTVRSDSTAGQLSLLVGVFAAVIGTDQIAKWWAWRHIDGSLINSGGYILLGPVIRSWFAGSVSGAVANVVGAVVLVVGVRWLIHRRRRLCVLVGGGLVAAGCLSNLLDRLGVHNWTAPGSERGVVDFIPSGGASRCNVADLWILLGALLLGYLLARRLAPARAV